MRRTHNSYGQLEEHPDYYVDTWPKHTQEMIAVNELMEACYEAYEKHCEPLMAYGFDPEYDSLPDFDDFKDNWFFEKAEKMTQTESEDDLGLDGDYWQDFTEALARELQEDDSVTAKGFMPYFNQWHKHGFYKAA